VPRHLLDDERYLERNLGGWAPVWFDALGVDDDTTDDPVLRARETWWTTGSSPLGTGRRGDRTTASCGASVRSPSIRPVRPDVVERSTSCGPSSTSVAWPSANDSTTSVRSSSVARA